MIYKICSRSLWNAAREADVLRGAPVDLEDGFIHFSDAHQVRETAARHFAGSSDLVLLTVDPRALGDALRYEPSRGGDLFPHLYASLQVDLVTRVDELPLGPGGQHVFPAHVDPDDSP